MKHIESAKLAVIAVAVAAVLFVSVNIISNAWLGKFRLDFTEGRAYSTSDQIKPVFENINEPIIVRLYYSEAVGQVSQRHALYYQRVRDLLQQYAGLAQGKLKLEFYNPEPFSDVEDRAVGFGLQGIPLGQGADVGYFGLAATNSTDDQQVIPFFNLERAQFLEYDLTKLIYSLSEPNQPKVGLITSLPLEGGTRQPNPMQMQMGGPPPQPTPSWAIIQQLKEFFAIQTLSADITEIPRDIQMLLLVQPENLSTAAQYAIDQFVLGGGKALVFVDPNSEAANPVGAMGMTGSNNLDGIKKLMAAWGVKLVDGQVVGDLDNAMRVNMQANGRPIISDYVAWLQLNTGNLDPNDAVTGDLKKIHMGTSGALEPVAGAGTTVTPLMQSSLRSMRIGTDQLVGMPDIVALFRDFKPQNKREILAVRITGTAKTAFADAPTETSLKEAKRPIQVVVVADTDMLADRFWVEINNFLGQQVMAPVADNGTFVINALENLTGSPALSSLRGRGVQSRPFVLIENIRRDAEMQYRAAEQGLTNRLEELQKKVADMQVKQGGAGEVILSEQDKKTIESYRGDILATRRELRDVQRALRQDIDRLEGGIKFVVIGGVPIVFGLLLIAVAAVRARRRRRTAAV
jgi:ABC-type uncharacterized transport system involved in gliding motility auxiliary subunit